MPGHLILLVRRSSMLLQGEVPVPAVANNSNTECDVVDAMRVLDMLYVPDIDFAVVDQFDNVTSIHR